MRIDEIDFRENPGSPIDIMGSDYDLARSMGYSDNDIELMGGRFRKWIRRMRKKIRKRIRDRRKRRRGKSRKYSISTPEAQYTVGPGGFQMLRPTAKGLPTGMQQQLALMQQKPQTGFAKTITDNPMLMVIPLVALAAFTMKKK